MLILILNAGSSSIKYKVFSYHNDTITSVFFGLIEGIGETNGSWLHESTVKEKIVYWSSTHQQAFTDLGTKLSVELQGQPIDAVAHRVVHGGTYFSKATVINMDVLAKIIELSSLAPLHNPVNVLGITCVLELFRQATHVAIFDTGFHSTLPPHTRYYPIDKKIAKDYHIQRYGFHGINHEYIAKQAAHFLGKALEECNFISLHLGNGASCCLIANGLSVDTSMGFTPLAGLMMGTRCGDVDPAIPIYLAKQGLSPETIEQLLNKNSGLKGICGNNDMREVLALQDCGDSEAALGITMYVSIIQKFIGGYLTQLDTIDAIVFTGGVGENSSYIREQVMEKLVKFGFKLNKTVNDQRNSLSCYSIAEKDNSILVVRSNEELLMAEKTISLCAALVA